MSWLLAAAYTCDDRHDRFMYMPDRAAGDGPGRTRCITETGILQIHALLSFQRPLRPGAGDLPRPDGTPRRRRRSIGIRRPCRGLRDGNRRSAGPQPQRSAACRPGARDRRARGGQRRGVRLDRLAVDPDRRPASIRRRASLPLIPKPSRDQRRQVDRSAAAADRGLGDVVGDLAARGGPGRSAPRASAPLPAPAKRSQIRRASSRLASHRVAARRRAPRRAAAPSSVAIAVVGDAHQLAEDLRRRAR